MSMDLAKFAIEKRLVSALSTLLILFAGYFAYQKLPRFEDPEFIIRQAQVITPYPGASAVEVAEEVTEVIENAIQQLQGVKEVRSVSSIGYSEVTVEFTIAAAKTRPAINQRFTQLRAKISDTQYRLPPNAGPATVYDDYGDLFALYYAITGDGYTLADLNAYAKALQRELVLVPGVSKVVLTGAPQEVIYVEYSAARLFKLGLSPREIAQVLEGQNLVTPSGSVVAGDTRLVIRPESAVGSIAAIEDLVIADASSGRTFRLKDIATVRRGAKEPADKRFFRDGRPAVAMGISNTLGGNVVIMSDAVKVRVADLEDERPIGIELTPISDQGESVRASIDDFVLNVVLALAIVVLTLLVFMGLRSGILMGGILLVTVAGTL
ncbi:MAG: efflux RND transporter permease subunit, partial [Halocynthiibacter sp.]